MNETFSKVLQIAIMFWLILGTLAIMLGPRIGTYFLQDDGFDDMTNINSLSGITLLWDIASFQVTEKVPLFVTIILDALGILTGLAIIMAVTNR